MTKKYRFYIGLNDKDTKKIIEGGRQKLLDALDIVFDSYTFILSTGRYVYIDSTICTEPSVIVEFVDFTNDIYEERILKNIVRYLKTKLNQETIMVEVTDVNIQLI